MDHIWKPSKTIELESWESNASICKTCGCVRIWNKILLRWDFDRSNKMFFAEMPECIDWNINTLD
jgi:hypothetical protein